MCECKENMRKEKYVCTVFSVIITLYFNSRLNRFHDLMEALDSTIFWCMLYQYTGDLFRKKWTLYVIFEWNDLLHVTNPQRPFLTKTHPLYMVCKTGYSTQHHDTVLHIILYLHWKCHTIYLSLLGPYTDVTLGWYSWNQRCGVLTPNYLPWDYTDTTGGSTNHAICWPNPSHVYNVVCLLNTDST